MMTNITPGTSLPVMNVTGIPITALPLNKQICTILEWAANRSSRFVCVANTHMLVEADREARFWQVLQSADLVTPDGMPLVWMMKLLGVATQDRVAGMDIFISLCQEAPVQNIPVFFVGSQAEVLDSIRKRLSIEFPNLMIAGMEPLPFGKKALEEDVALIQRINSSGAKIVFVCLGCPKQEYWMAKHRYKIQAVMIGLGGVFPIYAGIHRHAPQFFRVSGLEWLYRLLQEPKRLWKRYATTIPVFIWLAFKQLLHEFKQLSLRKANASLKSYDSSL
jgi:N-acetylglucosaminyldiphosphoundecaprenol N-acetyl-beta-D-mannosaminyltransferase